MLQKSVMVAMAKQLKQRAEQDRTRLLQSVTPLSSTQIAVAGTKYLQFSSNDYLGLGRHPKVLDAYAQAVAAGAGASALVTGYTEHHAELCALLSEVLQRPRVLLFNSAFAANVGVLTTLGPLYNHLYLDRLAHASLLQGAKHSGQRWRRFQHNDFATAERWLKKQPESALLISESIFSMDGDALANDALVSLLDTSGHGDVMLDDAHGFGVCGDAGRSVAADFSVAQVGLISLAFGKACGVAGGAVATDDASADYLVNYCPELIYSTAMPPAQASAIKAAIEIIISAEGSELRGKLAANVAYFQQLSQAAGLPLCSSRHAIQTLRIGSDGAALQMSQRLREAGIWCSAIRPPTVPEGTARLRLTLTAAHHEKDIRQLVQALQRSFAEFAT
ncbi:aminotransferase class I/II-fold pyridoxal phosphate-dependent enzyme [Pseudidiomarina homiensis]|uniref:aminotransferase class I/II-fold pyridoxal phosphate-dependent enzyme n=1 Tax=Pseudidiomarina homiensis TaxID=364198 RepID=UPI00215AAD4A|nr:aminotransferase class I/II-fold pyridoxal phosphate-dependent enzyme [Pseudidiomarina homiensis]